jgi:Zn-dependent M32 family carboxypeptidase
LNFYKEYKIEVQKGDQTWSVARRYNDFDALHTKLKKIHPNVKLKLPKKKLIGNNFDRDFIIKRQIGLNEYIQQVTSNPMIMKM